jgi:hypothetical protein
MHIGGGELGDILFDFFKLGHGGILSHANSIFHRPAFPRSPPLFCKWATGAEPKLV